MKATLTKIAHNYTKHNDARRILMAYHGISSRSAAKALKYINSFK